MEVGCEWAYGSMEIRQTQKPWQRHKTAKRLSSVRLAQPGQGSLSPRLWVHPSASSNPIPGSFPSRTIQSRREFQRKAGPNCLTVHSTPDTAPLVIQPAAGIIKRTFSFNRASGAVPVNAGVRPDRGADPLRCALHKRFGACSESQTPTFAVPFSELAPRAISHLVHASALAQCHSAAWLLG